MRSLWNRYSLLPRVTYANDQAPFWTLFKYRRITRLPKIVSRFKVIKFDSNWNHEVENNGPLVWARSIIPNLNVKTTRFYPVLCINAWQRILTFDEHANMKKNHKFAVFLQQHGQTTEDELLGNSTESQKFKDFLNALGTTVKLADHKG